MRWPISLPISLSRSRSLSLSLSLTLPLSVFLTTVLLYPPLTRAADIQIVDLSDIDFGVVPPTAGSLTADTEFCVALDPRGRYSLIGRGSGPAGNFQLIERGTGVFSIDYNVLVSDRGRNFTDLLIAGVPLSNQRGGRFLNNGRCLPSSHLRVVVPSGQLQSAAPGRYEGTLSLMVVPE